MKYTTGAKKESEDPLFFWTFPEYIKYDRGLQWYIISVAFSVVLIAYAIFSGNFLFAFIIVMVMIIALMQSVREPAEVQFAMYDDGVAVGNKFYTWNQFRVFWIAYDPPVVKKLFLDFKGMFRPHLSIELEQQNPLDVRKALLRYLDEDLERENEPASEELGRLFRL